ncbi:hypothetical protein [Nostoc sp. DedQUE07]|uniref:hypothetical protein n=1 Tax=Nostoc sp. DedQUE07 TaxID=3075392 RepID=UPI002AD33344|nr:hypothetical protein [Nostoc sp. DedQUE07]MDZ8131931.1 hypothetical protein [Nostoc sp. DedQUE07]
MGVTHRTHSQQRGAKRTNEASGTLDWNARYGNTKNYKKQCAIAHKSVRGLCCVCLTHPSQELHHAKYGCDRIGETVFPVCIDCHDNVCHSPKNWLKDKNNPVWKNKNTPEFTERLKLGYQLLYGGIE